MTNALVMASLWVTNHIDLGCRTETLKLKKHFEDLSRIKHSFKRVPLQFYFEIAGLASAKKWHEIQNSVSSSICTEIRFF